MPRPTCEPCCSPPAAFIGRAAFEPSVGIVLCDILAAIQALDPSATGTRFDWELLCDSDNDAAPVFVRFEYEIDGTIIDISAFNVDGTPWVGDILDLVSCECACVPTLLDVKIEDQGGASSSGAIDAISENINIASNGLNNRVIQIIGTWDGTLTFQTSVDGTNWTTLTVQKEDGTAVTNTTVNGVFFAPQQTGVHTRVISTAWSSGSATVFLAAYMLGNSERTLSSPVSRPTTRYRNLALSNTGAVIKASPGSIHFLHMANPDPDDAAYVKLYNQTDAPDSTDTPVETYFIPANSPHGFVLPIDLSAFSTGIGIRASQGSADNDNVAPSTALIINARYS